MNSVRATGTENDQFASGSHLIGVSLPALFTAMATDATKSAEVPTLSGWIDTATRSLIEGWVWNPADPSHRVALELLQDGKPIATTFADRDRPPLIEAGIGDGRHAFRIELPSGLLSRDAQILHLRCAVTGVAVPGSPISIATAAEPLPPPLRWHVDEINDTGVIGWIFATQDPSRRCVVALKEGSLLHARAAASRFRPGLREAGLGDGNCAFFLPLPRSLLDGAEHVLQIVEEASGTVLTTEPLVWRTTAGTAGADLTGVGRHTVTALPEEPEPAVRPAPRTEIEARTLPAAASLPVKTRLLFDITDLVDYIGTHPNLTGIQRVQVSLILALLEGALPPELAAIFISYSALTRRWEAVPITFLTSLLRDLFLPELHRITRFSPGAACAGHLPGAHIFDAASLIDDGTPSVLCLLGAGWNKPDHFHKILTFKRRYGTRFVMLVHDLIPIVARETCYAPTAHAFEAFLRRAARHADHFLTVSQSTARDLRRFVTGIGLPDPTISVTRNGSTFDEFQPAPCVVDRASLEDLPARFVLYVSTVEGRKNHLFLLDLWRRMIAAGDNPPHLICVGRIGWRSERFISEVVESNYLDGLVILQQDVSDAYLRLLYESCLLTVYPSLYEGWGLPVGESLAAGKVCVCSTSASLPEVADGLAHCLDPHDTEAWLSVLRALIHDEPLRRRQEMTIRSRYRAIPWASVAAGIASACDAAADTLWQDPYPLSVVPYGTEISFAHPGDEAENGAADGQVTRIIETRRGHFLPEPLTEASFVRGEESRADGIWAEPEPWGTWLCQNTGGLALALAPSESDVLYVFLRLRASDPAVAVPARITANGELAWQGRLAGRPQDIMLRVRRRVSGLAGWRLKLRVEMELPANLRQLIAAMDSRMPVIGFERLVVVPEDDVKTRLDVLTTLHLAAAL